MKIPTEILARGREMCARVNTESKARWQRGVIETIDGFGLNAVNNLFVIMMRQTFCANRRHFYKVDFRCFSQLFTIFRIYR